MKIENEWIQLQEDLNELTTKRDNDVAIASIDEKIDKLNDKKKAMEETHNKKLIPLSHRLNEINKEFLSMYDGQKTLPLDVLTLTFRDTKSLKVLNPRQIVDTLVKIDQVASGVKSFALKKLRVLAEAEVLPAESYEWDVKLNVTVKEREE